MKRTAVASPKRPTRTRRTNKRPKISVHNRGSLLVHVRHTGRLLPHSATSYPLLTFLVLLVGVLMAMCSSLTSADTGSYTVNAVVPGIIITSPAVITSPVGGDHFTSVPITVSGTCPANATYVKLYRNDYFSGAAVCNGGAFTLQSDLFQGANVLKAIVFNAADQSGPPSSTITVYNDAPPTNPANPSSGSGNTGNSSPTKTGNTTKSSSSSSSNSNSNPNGVGLSLSADYNYRGYTVGTPITWTLGITGGTAPYSINIDWSDNHDTSQKQPIAGAFNITHTYTKPVREKTAYPVKITATDANGDTAFVQIVALITVPGVRGTGLIIAGDTTGVVPPPQPTNSFIVRILPYAWPAYAVTAIMLASFWLGEHREFNMLRNNIHTPKRLRHT